MPLNERQKLFVNEYLIDLNATKAAIRAGYSEKTAHISGNENIRKYEISKAIREAMLEREIRTEITQDRVLKELGRLAFLDIRKAFRADGSMKQLHELDDDTAAAISGFDITEINSGDNAVGVLKKIKLSDKKSALELIGRHLQMFEKVKDDKNYKTQINIDPATMAKLSEDELKTMMELLDKL